MDSLYLLVSPFIENGFMRRALVAGVVLSFSAAPIGVFLLLRRMSLVSDALSHGVLPGVAIAYLYFGTSLLAMTVGGFIAGLVIALLSGIISKHTPLKEEASFAGIYLGSLALGVSIISVQGSSSELLHFLFGSILAVNSDSLFQIGVICSLSMLVLAGIYRILVIESFDANFLILKNKYYSVLAHLIFLCLVVLNLVGGFQILGTLMTVGLLILPALTANLWCKRLESIICLAILIAIISSYAGLLWSFYDSRNIPSGPAIILSTVSIFLFSVFFGSNGGVFSRYFKKN